MSIISFSKSVLTYYSLDIWPFDMVYNLKNLYPIKEIIIPDPLRFYNKIKVVLTVWLSIFISRQPPF